jgi:phosphoglycolate phosphatase
MKKVFFDFDGTLAETSRGIIKGYSYAFEKKGMPNVPEDIIRKNIGPPLKEVLAILAPSESAGVIDELAVLYREYFSSEGLYELKFFDGIPEMLECISGKAQLRIISSKPTVFIEKILERYGYDKFFTTVDGVSLGYANKSKGERLKGRMICDGLAPSDCIVVGDRAEDMNAARHCGMGFIGVLFGYGSEDEMNGSATAGSVEDLKDPEFYVWAFLLSGAGPWEQYDDEKIDTSPEWGLLFGIEELPKTLDEYCQLIDDPEERERVREARKKFKVHALTLPHIEKFTFDGQSVVSRMFSAPSGRQIGVDCLEGEPFAR